MIKNKILKVMKNLQMHTNKPNYQEKTNIKDAKLIIFIKKN